MSVPLESPDLFSNSEYLCERLKQRSMPAFEFLYNKYSTPLYSFVLSMTQDVFVSDKVLEKVFSLAWKKISEYDCTKGSIFTWMYALARAQSILHKRQQELRKLVHRHEPENVRDLVELRQLIMELPDPFSSILLLSYFENAGDVEIAGLMNLEMAAVKDCRNKGLVMVNKILSGGDEIKKPFHISERVLAF